MPPAHGTSNRLLASLDPAALEALWPRLKRVRFGARQPILHQGGLIGSVHFIESGMVSMAVPLAGGTPAVVGLVGREGATGLPLLAGVSMSLAEVTMQLPGTLLRMSARDFRQEMEENQTLRLLLLRYSQGIGAQLMQTAACNSRHELEERLARWLLMLHDQQDGDELELSQDFIASLLGVHRPSVTVTAGILQAAGLIRFGGGKVAILDRAGLEAASCSCYGVVRERLDTLLPPPGKPRD